MTENYEKLKWYLSHFGVTEIFKSETVDDLNKSFEDPNDYIHPSLYGPLIQLAEQKVSKMQSKLKYMNQQDIDECETPEDLEKIIEFHASCMAMTPKQFWMFFNG